MSDVDLLREAATKMRERAEAATPGPWRVVEEHGRDAADEAWSRLSVQTDRGGQEIAEIADPDLSYAAEHDDGNAEHIASWDPTVALAVADWLDFASGEFFDSDPPWTDCPTAQRAVKVARAYLRSGS